MWTWWRMLKISWTETVTNEEVLVCANEARSILETVWHRKHRWLGCVFGHENFLHDIIEGKMVCRKRMELLHDIMEGRERFNLRQIKMETE